jgi:hypothetical protein
VKSLKEIVMIIVMLTAITPLIIILGLGVFIALGLPIAEWGWLWGVTFDVWAISMVIFILTGIGN